MVRSYCILTLLEDPMIEFNNASIIIALDLIRFYSNITHYTPWTNQQTCTSDKSQPSDPRATYIGWPNQKHQPYVFSKNIGPIFSWLELLVACSPLPFFQPLQYLQPTEIPALYFRRKCRAEVFGNWSCWGFWCDPCMKRGLIYTRLCFIKHNFANATQVSFYIKNIIAKSWRKWKIKRILTPAIITLTLKGQCKPHGLGIILRESCSKLLFHCTKWGF